MKRSVTMVTKKDLPSVYDEGYLLTAAEQTIIIEVSFINSFILEQVRMPMVRDMLGGVLLVSCFQKCLAACLITLVGAGLITEEFYINHEQILDEDFGIKNDVSLSTMEVSDLAYDLDCMLSQYLVVLGHELALKPDKDWAYGNEEYFTPRFSEEES